MNTDLIITLCLLAACIAAFVCERPRMDVAALLAFAALPLLGILDFKTAAASFGDTNILIIAMMFILSAGLMRTGISSTVGNYIVQKADGSRTKLIIYLMCAVALIGSVMSTTGVVAIFIPIVLTICSRLNIAPSRLMMPIGFAGIISGMMTLVATSSNLILNGELMRSGFKGVKFFDITPVGLAVLALGIIYMLYVRRFLGSHETLSQARAKRVKLTDFIKDYDLGARERIFKIGAHSQIVGKTLEELALRENYGANIICMERRGRMDSKLIIPAKDMRLSAGDVILVDMQATEKSDELSEKFDLSLMSLRSGYFANRTSEIGMIEVVVSPESSLIGCNLIEAQFRTKYGLFAIGLRRNSKPITDGIYSHKLRMGDILLLMGAWKSVRHLNADSSEFMVLNIPEEYDTAVAAPGRAPYAVLSLAVMLVLMVTNAVPTALAVLTACILMVLTKCISIDKAYESVHWPAIMLIVGMMPFAAALDKTGGIDLAAKLLLDSFGAMGPRGMLLGLCILTMITGLFVSNTITAILIAPLTVAAAESMGLSPYPFVIGVSVAASTAFSTPLSTSVNILIMGPGRYKFADFLKFGLPFSLIVLALNVAFVPVLFPF